MHSITNVMASSDVSSTRPSTVVESYQFLRSSIDRIFDDLLCDQDVDMNSIDKAFTWLENLSDSLSIWAVDVRVRDSSLLKLEGTSIGRSLLALFIGLTTELMPSQRLLAAFPPDGKGKTPLETTNVVGTTSQSNSTDLKLVLNLLYQLQDSVEPIRQILATYQTGPHSATNKQIEEIYTSVPEKSFLSVGAGESDKSNKKLATTATESTKSLSGTSSNSTAQSTQFPHTKTYSSKKSNEGRRVAGNDRRRVKIYEKGHKQQNAFDTGYDSGFDSPRETDERTSLDYVATSTSPKPREDNEPYEIIAADSKPRHTESDGVSDRKQDTQAPNQRKRDARYVIRTPESPGLEAEIVPNRRATQVFQQQLSNEPEKTIQIQDSQRLVQTKQLERLERQIEDRRAWEAERRLKQQQQIEDLERRSRDLEQRTEEQRKREALITRHQSELAERQWEEIQAVPPPTNKQRRVTVHANSTNRGSPQGVSLLDCDSPFLAPILEAQKDEEARRAREANDEESRSESRDSRSARRAREHRRRGDDDRYVV